MKRFKRRRWFGSDNIVKETKVGSLLTGDTASNLGNAMDELMRHQPSLRTDATKAIIKVTDDSFTETVQQTYSALSCMT